MEDTNKTTTFGETAKATAKMYWDIAYSYPVRFWFAMLMLPIANSSLRLALWATSCGA